MKRLILLGVLTLGILTAAGAQVPVPGDESFVAYTGQAQVHFRTQPEAAWESALILGYAKRDSEMSIALGLGPDFDVSLQDYRVGATLGFWGTLETFMHMDLFGKYQVRRAWTGGDNLASSVSLHFTPVLPAGLISFGHLSVLGPVGLAILSADVSVTWEWKDAWGDGPCYWGVGYRLFL